MKIAVALPTRGLVFARTLKSLRDNQIDMNLVFIVEGLPIPDGHNEAVRMALTANPDRILIMEDDMVLPDKAIKKMVSTGGDIVYCDYPMDNAHSTVCKYEGEIYWGGLGCTLIRKEVFESIGKFTCDHSWKIEKNFKLTRVDNPNKYGGHDINFGMKAQTLGFKMAKINIEAEHLRCQNLIKSKNNKGAYQIQPLEKIKYYQNH